MNQEEWIGLAEGYENLEEETADDQTLAEFYHVKAGASRVAAVYSAPACNCGCEDDPDFCARIHGAAPDVRW